MLQAIELKYYGPTNHRGSRIKATAQCGTRWYNWDHGSPSATNFTEAAKRFAQDWGWDGSWIGGATESGYVFVRYSAYIREGEGSFTVKS